MGTESGGAAGGGGATRRAAVDAVLRRERPARVVYAPNVWQWFAHHRNHGLLPPEIAHCTSQVEVIRNQPTEGSRKLLVQAMIEDMAQKAAFLGGQIQDQDQARKMAQVQETLRQIQYDLSR